MRINIDVDFIRSINSSDNEYVCPVELEMDRKHLCNMLKNDVKCCVLVTGYRGVGKSSFIESVLDQLKLETEILIVKMNLANYDNYSVFMKRLIRGIYFTCLENKDKFETIEMKEVFERVELLYIHTFYNVLDYYKEENNEELGHSVQTEVISKDSIKNLIKKWLEVLPDIAAVFCVWYASQNWITKLLLSVVYLISKLFSVSIKIKSWKSEKRDKKYGKEIESLYDDEIAEYQLFETIKQIEMKKRLLFVFDEVDKIEDDKKIKQVIDDIKPLLLSNRSSFIFIAGREMKCFVSNQLEKEDSVVSSLFSKEVYISLGTFDEMINMWNKFVLDETERDFELENKYLFSKLLSSKGIMRKFINEIIADINWEVDEEDNCDAYIEIEDSNWPSDVVIRTISNFMESYESTFDEKEKDDYLYQLYRWADVVLKKEIIELEKLISDKDKMSREQCKEFLDTLKNNGVFDLGVSGNKYIRKRPNKNRNIEKLLLEDENSTKKIMENFERVAGIILAFGRINGVTKLKNVENVDKKQLLIELKRILVDLKIESVIRMNTKNQYQYSVLDEFFKMYEQLYSEKQEEISLQEFKQISTRAERQVGILVEALLQSFLKEKLAPGYEIRTEGSVQLERIHRYDIAIFNSYTMNVEVAIECKVYRYVMKGFIESLKRTIQAVESAEGIKPKRILFFVFVDKDELDRGKRIKTKGEEILNEMMVNGKIYIIDWGNFDKLIGNIMQEDDIFCK